MAFELPAYANPRLNREAQTKIGLQLQAMYVELMRQELPEQLRELLDRLDAPARQQNALRPG